MLTSVAIVVVVISHHAITIGIDFVALRAVAIVVDVVVRRVIVDVVIVVSQHTIAIVVVNVARCAIAIIIDNSITTRATTLYRQRQRRLRIAGNNTIMTRATTPAQLQQVQCVTREKIADTSQTDPCTYTGTPRMRTGSKAENFAYGESPYA
jgi:hypothetical protein